MNVKRLLTAINAGKLLFIAGLLFLIIAIADGISYKPGVLLLFAGAAFLVSGTKKLSGYSFTGWVVAGVVMAMLYPDSFHQWGALKLEVLIIPLTQLIMFGMGATLSVADFYRVAKSPWPVFTGVFVQYSVMPVVGFLVVLLFGFEGEVAAGIVLIGSVSGGMASNLMTYLARGNVALSVTMTFISTLVAPLATPVLMKLFAGTFVAIDTFRMMLSIVNMIIVPLLAGLLAHEIIYGRRKWVESKGTLMATMILAVVLTTLVLLFGGDLLGPLRTGALMGCFLVIVILLVKMIMISADISVTVMDRILPMISMVSICTVLIILIAQTHDMFMNIGLLLLFAAMIHNAVGYGVGYWTSKAFGYAAGHVGYRLGFFKTSASRISETESRTVAIEVGMQNGGMATGLAIDVLKSYAAALPPNVFGTWMNISGSLLANYWQQRPIRDNSIEQIKAQEETVLELNT